MQNNKLFKLDFEFFKIMLDFYLMKFFLIKFDNYFLVEFTNNFNIRII